MDNRIVDFIAGLRAAGVRVSIAESEDAFNATRSLGVVDKIQFQDALRATLVKEVTDRPVFDQLFPLYFGSGGPPLQNLTEGMSPEEKRLLAQAMRALLAQMRQAQQNRDRRRRDSSGGMNMPPGQLDRLMQLLQQLLQGNNPSSQEMDDLAHHSGMDGARDLTQQSRISQQMRRQMGMELLEKLMEQLAAMLAQLGMDQQAIKQLMEGIEANREALADRIAQHVGAALARKQVESFPDRKQEVSDLMHRPFQSLTDRESELLRDEVRRLASQLRSRAALRRKRSKGGTLDVKKVVRTNMRYGGVPLELKFKTRQLKPKLLLVCDVSTSMRSVVEFLLRMIYELQDQVASAHSFAYIGDLEDISDRFAENVPEVAIEIVLTSMPPGHYNTDLGNSLNTLMMRFADKVDHRTTVIFVGDARNNYNDPRLDLMDRVQRRSKRLVWFNPEHPRLWGTGDSDMLVYLPFADVVHNVSNLAELAEAIDKLLTGK